MKIATYDKGGEPRLGLVIGEGLVDIARHLPDAPKNMIALMQQWAAFGPKIAGLSGATPDEKLAAVHLRAPVERPGKIFAIGLNYADHVAESKMEMPKHQIWFSKAVTSVNGPYDPIEIPTASAFIDYEAEMVAIIGTRCKNVTKEQAKNVIFGYAVGNDVTTRDWQHTTPQWTLGKSFDKHAPFGPWIVTSDELGNPHDLDIRCFVNGEQRQSSNTRHLIFDVYDQIAHLSKAMTLEPGDVIFTGTPGGIGAAMDPMTFLRSGDRVRVEIDRLGAIEGVMQPEAM